ncbi:hypothetical protein Vretimale_17474 [Volvox reticuliferus]|uniref:CAF1B/HIR1 beta-propeller domain-containing protein n=1 Tax=Volvox reticuliferus TaxID=1737510 RepID=A0A8J4D764_9CHLO|nr:hypothetical protein Vretifemale_20796 [Volvox reticuliferus]GIM14553.1 hypothetical protein Vretimale_17474 [Volvox reticuliferus]
MQLKTLQIVWHGKEPVLSVDFQPSSHTFASGGQDGEVKHWEVVAEEDGSPGVRFLSSYPVNSKSVNCVRFSPAGDMLASAGDKGEVLLWRFAAFAAGAQPLPQLQQQPQQQRGPLDGGDGDVPAFNGSSAAAASSGMWRQVGLLRGHCDDVLDLAWAPDGSALISGGIENNCILWDVEARKSLKWLQDHGHYVQGVAWDPLGRYIASQSADRTARVYAVKPPPGTTDGGIKRATVAPANPSVVTSASLARDGFYAAATLSKGPLPLLGLQHQQPAIATGGVEGEAAAAGGGDAVVADGQQLQPGQEGATAAPIAGGGVAKQPLFCDDSLPTFFRRLAWSPDGAFLAMPAGMYRAGISAPVTSTTHIFSRGDWSGPALSLPCLSKGALVVRFCPRLFRAPRPLPPPPSASAPESTATAGTATASLLTYRIIMAVASVDSVVLYDMQALEPLAVLGGIHFAAVTDLAWSDDGRYLVVASRDGYCTVCSFEEGELGEPVHLEELPASVAAAVSRAAARRYHERTAVVAALKAVAAVATAATVAAPPVSATEEELGAPALPAASDLAAAVEPEAPISAAGPRRIQPIPIACVGSDVDVTGRTGPGGAAGGDTAMVASAKRPAEGDPSIAGGAGDRPKPKRIQPIPLSATALTTALPDIAATGGGCAGRDSSCGFAASSAGTVVTAAGASPGRRRIVPTRIDGPSSGAGHPASVAATAATATALAPGGRSPLLAATPAPVSDIAMAPTRTPVLVGADGMVLPGVAAPGSAAKMPTPQVLVFGTPPSSALWHHGGDGPGGGAPVSEHCRLAVAASKPLSQSQSQSKPKRVTPVPVDRGNRSILAGDALPAALPPPAVAPALLPNRQGQLTHAGEGLPQPSKMQSECEDAQAPVCNATVGHGTAVAPSDVSTGGDSDAGGASPGSGAAAGGADGGGGAGGSRFSVAQLAVMRGAAAARKAAEGTL